MPCKSVILTDFQRRFYEADRAEILNSSTLHAELLFRCIGTTPDLYTNNIISILSDAHQILNSRIVLDSGNLLFEFVEGTDGIEVLDVPPPTSGTRDEAEALEYIREYSDRRFQLGSEAPIRFVSVGLSREDRIFGAILHHAIYDAESIQIVARDMERLLRDPHSPLDDGIVTRLPFSSYMAGKSRSSDQATATFWKSKLVNVSGRENFGHLYEQEPGLVAKTFSVAEGRLDQLDALSRTGYTLNLLFISAAIYALRVLSGNNSIMVEAVSSDRSSEETANTVGCLLDIFPILVDIPADIDFVGLASLVRRAYVECYANSPGSFLRLLSEIDYHIGNSPHINWIYKPVHAVPQGNDGGAGREPGVWRYDPPRPKMDVIAGINPDVMLPFAFFAGRGADDINGHLVSVWLSAERIDALIRHMDVFLTQVAEAPSSKCFPG